MNYTNMDIVNHIIEHTNQNGKPITYELLEKILYYCQAYFLVNKNKQLIEEDFYVWNHGPTEKISYSYLKEYGATPLTKQISYAVRKGNGQLTVIDPKNRNIDKRDSKIINFVTDKIIDRFRWIPFRLVKITQAEPFWQENKQEIENNNIYITYNLDEVNCPSLKWRACNSRLSIR